VRYFARSDLPADIRADIKLRIDHAYDRPGEVYFAFSGKG
jgi:hypothetical protein